MTREDIIQQIIRRKAVAVLRVKEVEKLKDIIRALYAGGISVIELTTTIPNAIQVIEKLSKEIEDDVIIGVGTVLAPSIAEAAIKAGAKYVVSPIFKKEIVEVAHNHGLPVMPGAFTPTEIQTAYECGADIVKVFPADVLGKEFFKGVLAPMPYLKLMPTGGVSLTNADEWLDAGACAVGIGSALLDKEAIKTGNYQKLTDNARMVMKSVERAVKKS
ncbi:MAG: bifunctional 4-hydroxy-2-oxoglutarate aldolase/2-dehydro-3-deoxy-phosphogluconate aldolase [Candidatus Kryptoniota bacterium]